MPTADKRAFISGKYAFEFDGHQGGWLHSAEGGGATADVVTEKLGVDHHHRKHIGGVKYEDISVAMGTGMSKGVYEWIKASFDHNYARKNGAVITCNYNYKEMSRLTFNNALITEIAMPALDAASKDAAKVTLKLSPEYTRVTQSLGGGPSVAGGKYKTDPKVQKKWLPANFKLEIDGLDCTRVSKVEAITLKQKVVQNAVGEMRDYEMEPAYLEIPNLVVTLAESHSEAWAKWHEDFVIKGNNGDDAEKGGRLTFLTPNLKEELFTLTFSHLGIFKITADKVESGAEGIRRLKAEMYCEEMKFEYKASWA
jgi:phage tail-like protein